MRENFRVLLYSLIVMCLLSFSLATFVFFSAFKLNSKNSKILKTNAQYKKITGAENLNKKVWKILEEWKPIKKVKAKTKGD